MLWFEKAAVVTEQTLTRLVNQLSVSLPPSRIAYLLDVSEAWVGERCLAQLAEPPQKSTPLVMSHAMLYHPPSPPAQTAVMNQDSQQLVLQN